MLLRKEIFTVFFMLNIGFLFSQNINTIDKNGLKQGKWIELDAEGNKKYEGEFKNNLPQGKFIYYYPNQKIKSVVYYSNNGLNASATYFYEQGNKKAEGRYVHQKKDSMWIYYNDSEVIIMTEQYNDGNKHGVCKVFYSSGKLAEIDSFKLNVKHGMCMKFFENGNKKVECEYKEDYPDGRYIEYYSDGKFKAIGKYLNGLKSGKWDYYNEEGEIHFKESYNLGDRVELFKVNGEFEEYYNNPEEILKEKVNYKAGKKHGPFVEYYEIGEWKLKPVTYNQELFSDTKEEMVKYFDGQKIKRRGNYLNDLLEGEIEYFDEQGDLQKVEIYKNGIKISEQ